MTPVIPTGSAKVGSFGVLSPVIISYHQPMQLSSRPPSPPYPNVGCSTAIWQKNQVPTYAACPWHHWYWDFIHAADTSVEQLALNMKSGAGLGYQPLGRNPATITRQHT